MSWYVAKSLDQLLRQLNAKAPNRSKVSDGSIGDAAHSARLSDHNPTATGQVCARDFTNDPAGGLPGQWLADTLVASRDSRIKYVIFNHRIIDSRAGNHPWQWMPYDGQNAHEHHVHVSVFAGPLGDDARPWNLGAGTSGEDDDMQADERRALFEVMEQLVGTRELDKYPGWQSKEYPNDPKAKATVTDFVRFIDQNVIRLAREQAEQIKALNARLDTIAAAISQLTPKGA